MTEQGRRISRWTTYTLNHKQTNIKTFLLALKKFKIRTVLDVRACPNTHKIPDWKLAKLKALCMEKGYKYKWKGQLFGGNHQAQHLITKLNNKEDGPYLLRSIFNLIEHPIIILCTESMSKQCYRKYISDALIVHKLSTVKHIMFDGNEITAFDYVRSTNSKIKSPESDEQKEDELSHNVVENTEIEFIQKITKEMSADDLDKGSSLCVIPPSSTWQQLQMIQKVASAHGKWPPRFDILCPFVAEKYCPSQLKHIENALRGIKPFRVVLSKFGYLNSAPAALRNSVNSDPICYVFLEPNEEAVVEFQRIYDALCKLYPFCVQAKHAKGFQAHLIMGQFPKSKCIEWVSMMNEQWEPIEYQCDALALIAKVNDSAFEIRQQAKLSQIPYPTPFI